MTPEMGAILCESTSGSLLLSHDVIYQDAVLSATLARGGAIDVRVHLKLVTRSP